MSFPEYRKRSTGFVLNLALLPAAIGLVLAANTAQASAFQLKENSAKALGRAFAGAGAAPDDYSVVINNPAAMIDLQRGVQGDLTAVQFKTEFSGSGSDALGRPLTGGNGGNAGAVKPIPAFSFVMPVGDRYAVGAAVSAPYGFVTDYDAGWQGRYGALKSDLQSPALTLSGAWKANDRLSFGVSAIIQRTTADLSSAIDFGTILMQPTQGAVLPQSADGKVRITGDDWGYGWQAGMLWKPTDRDRIGFNYHSKIEHTIEGKGNFTVPAAIAPLLGTRFTDTGGRADFTTPAFAELSWWHTVNDRWSVGAQATYTRWSSFKDLTVKFDNPVQPDSVELYNWDNTWFGSVGADYKLDQRWTLRGGFAVDGSPTHVDTRSPRVPDGTRRWLSFGVGYQPSEELEINLGYAHLFVNDAQIDTSTATANRLTGRYEGSSNLLSVSAQYRF